MEKNMKPNSRIASQKPPKQKSTKALYIGAVVTGVFAVASLINNILLFKNSVDMYTLQGYPVAEVLKQLIPAQLLPGVFEAIAIYGGITVLLIAAAIINEKASQWLASLNNQQECNETVQEIVPETTAEENTDPENHPEANPENEIED